MTTRALLLVLSLCLLNACANIVPPTGGNKDVTPPRLLSVTPADSQLNAKVARIELRFDEYIEVSNPGTQVTIAPLLSVPLDVSAQLRRVVVKIPDSLLQENTTYRISFNNSIKDINEGNVFSGYDYIFSTGSWFDSLALAGNVQDAFTGRADSSAIVVLYDASLSDSSVVKAKPSYVTRVDAFGNFQFKGLPSRAFRIYAMRDANSNFIYDGGGEAIAFQEATVIPGDTAMAPILLRLFVEAGGDTVAAAAAASPGQNRFSRQRQQESGRAAQELDGETFTYSVAIDTSDLRKRTVELTEPFTVRFSRPANSFNKNRVYLTFDSSGVAVESDFTIARDTSSKSNLLFSATWKPEAVYTLRLLKGFASDTSGADALPSRWVFRTKREEDYAKLQIHLPSAWGKGEHVLLILRERDTFYHQPVRDTVLRFNRIMPASYSMRAIHDVNRDSVWTTGDLFLRRQPEVVIPYENTINLKPGWENQIDFVPQPADKRRDFNSRGKREASR